jgi:hypothetical protein
MKRAYPKAKMQVLPKKAGDVFSEELRLPEATHKLKRTPFRKLETERALLR